MSLILRPPWTRQPPGVPQIDWSHPLTRGLVVAAVPVGARFYDAVTKQLSEASGTPKAGVPITGNRAPAIRIANPGTASKFPNPTGADVIDGTSQWSVFAECSPEVNAQSRPPIFASTEPSNGYGFIVGVDDALSAYNGMAAGFNYTYASGAFSGYDVLGTDSELYVHRIAWVRESANMVFYANGAQVYSAATSGSITSASTRRGYLLTSVAGITGQAAAALICVWNRALTAAEYAALNSNPWQLFEPRRIWVPVSVSSGAQTLTTDLFSNTNTFYTHTVTTGSVTLTPDLFSNSNSFYTHTINSVYTLLPDLFTNTNTFYTNTVTTGAVTLTPDLFTNTNSFYTPTVSSSYIVTPDLFTNTNTFYTPVVTNLSTLYPDLFTNSQTFYTHVVTGGGGQTLEPELFSNSATFYGPTITVGSVTLTASLFTNTNDVYTHTVTSNYPLTPDLFSNSSSFYTPTISVGGVTLTPDLFSNSNTFYTHSISNGSTVVYFWKRTA